MNLAEMHDRIDAYLDRSRSPRYTKTIRDMAINTAIDQFVKDRYDNIKRDPRGYSFEIVERVREELFTLVETDYPITIVGNLTPSPPDFLYHVVTYINTSAGRVLSVLKSYVENDLTANSFTKPKPTQPIHRRTNTGFIFDVGSPASFSGSGQMTYIKYPAKVRWDETVISASPGALVPGNTYYVVSGPIIHAGNTYAQGQTFVASATSFVGGTVNLLNNCNLPQTTHEEICKIAARIISGSYEDYNKSQNMEQENRQA